MVDDLLDGSARFVADLAVDALVLRFVTSTEAHAHIEDIATEAAAAVPGVVAVLTAQTLPTIPIHEIALIPEEHAQPALADGEVRFVGEQVVAVVAETAAIAADAAELVEIDYAPLPAIVDLADAEDDDAVLAWDEPAAAGAFAAAEVSVRSSFTIPRVAVAPMEGRSVLAVPEPDGRLTLHASTQSPHWTRAQVSRSLDVPFHRLRVITPHVGGGFGGKAVGGVPAYVVAAAAARHLGRPVRFVEPRADNLVTMPGRGLHFDVALHARRDGTIVGLEVDERCDAGAYPAAGSIEPGKTRLMAAGPYRVPAVSFRARSLRTNLAPTGAYRGPGRSEAAAVLERLLDLLALELALDPAEVRARNLLRAEELPATSVTGAHYDRADLPALLDQLLEEADCSRWRDEQARRRARGDRCLLGIGLATVVDSTAWFARQEGARVRVLASGRVRVVAGTASAGQRHDDAYAALVAEVLPVAIDDIEVVEGDTDAIDESGGTSGSRSLQLAGSAIHGAALAVLEQARDRAAQRLEASAHDIVVEGGRFIVRGVPARGVTLAELAASDGDPPLAAHHRFDQPEATYSRAAHLSVITVDVDTGRVTPLHHQVVTDCGRVIDLASATGQVVGASVQGIAQALYEELVHDRDGNPLTTTLADYLVPTAADVPAINTVFVETDSSGSEGHEHRNPLGARGVGEIGMVGAPAAVHGAVLDAISHLGPRHVEMPCTPERVWRALHSADATGLDSPPPTHDLTETHP